MQPSNPLSRARETEERRPISVVNASWWVMHIDRNGFYDEKKKRGRVCGSP